MYVHPHTSIGTRRPGRILPDVAAEVKASNFSRRYLLEDKRGKTHIDRLVSAFSADIEGSGVQTISVNIGIFKLQKNDCQTMKIPPNRSTIFRLPNHRPNFPPFVLRLEKKGHLEISGAGPMFRSTLEPGIGIHP